MKRWKTKIASFVFLSALFGCQGKSLRIIYDRGGSDAKSGGAPGAWSDEQYASAKGRCVADFTLNEAKATQQQIEAFCGCLVTFARDKYSYGEYMGDPNGLRDRQAKQGQVDECRSKASLPPLSSAGRTWQPQVLFDNDPFFKSNPTVVTLPANKMAVTYGKAVNGRNLQYAVHFDGTKWGAPQAVGENYDYLAVTKSNDKGQIIAIWATAVIEPDGSFLPNGLSSATFDPVRGWQTAVVHRDVTSAGYVTFYNASIDQDGNIVLTWTVANSDTLQNDSYMRLYTNGAWQAITPLGGPEYLWPTVVITPDKTLHALVGVGDPVRREVIMHAGRVPLSLGRLTAADFTALEQPQGIDVLSSGAEIGVDAKGNMTAIWNRGTQAPVPADWRTKITVASYDVTKGRWDVRPDFSSNGNGPAFFQRLRMAPNGTAFAVWVQNEGTRQLIWASRFDMQKGWAPPTPIDHNAAVESSAPALSVNNKGEAIAVWAKRSLLDEKGWITMASYYNGFYWSNETAISTKTAGNVTAFPAVSLNEDGKGFAFWTQGDGFEEPDTEFMYMTEFK